MKVFFLKLVPNVGHIWEVKEVSDSYARNFLIPKWFAKKIDANEEKRLKEESKKIEEKRRTLIEDKHKIIEKLNWKTIIFKAQTLDNWKMFWWIKESDIIKQVKVNFDIELDKKHINMPNWHIKKIWNQDIYIKLWDVMAKINIIVE